MCYNRIEVLLEYIGVEDNTLFSCNTLYALICSSANFHYKTNLIKKKQKREILFSGFQRWFPI